MTKNKNLKILIFSLATFFILVQLSLPKPGRDDFAPVMVAPPKALVHTTFGFQKAVADILWVRYIQDVDLCATSGGFGSTQAYKNRKVFDPKLNYGKCEKGWSYEMIDRITDLDPDFRIALDFGILMLSVLIKDIAGGTLLIEKGIARYPSDLRIAQKAAYHFMYEDINITRASEVLRVAAKNGAPDWYLRLASKLDAKAGDGGSGNDEFALNYLLSEKKQLTDPEGEAGQILDARIKEVQDRIAQKNQ